MQSAGRGLRSAAFFNCPPAVCYPARLLARCYDMEEYLRHLLGGARRWPRLPLAPVPRLPGRQPTGSKRGRHRPGQEPPTKRQPTGSKRAPEATTGWEAQAL